MQKNMLFFSRNESFDKKICKSVKSATFCQVLGNERAKQKQTNRAESLPWT